MSHALLGVPLNQSVVFRLFGDGKLNQLEKILFALPLPKGGLDVDFLVREEATPQMALGGET